MKKTRIAFAFLFCAALGWQARAQTFDTSGNGMLSGNYYFRQVYVSGNGEDLTSAYGEISFSGTGTYTMSASEFDYSAAQEGEGPQPLTASGTYSISASGLGYLSNPLAGSGTNAVYGLVSQGIFIGSSTQNPSGFNDMFVAAPIPSGTPAFSGTYSGAFVDQYEGISGSYQLNPNGSGSIGTVGVTYYYLSSTTNAAASSTVNEAGVKYSTANGAESLTFPTSTSVYYPLGGVINGAEYLYVSPDGNFVFGGSPYGWDFFVGVHPTTTPTFSGLYYQAGLDLFPDGYYGSFDAIPSLGLLGHQRVLGLGQTPIDYTYSDSSALNGNGSYDDGFGIHHIFGKGGALSIGYGTDGNSGINVAIQGPTLSGSGIYLNPTGVQNVGSFALFTAGIAPGEYIQLNGTGFTSSTLRDPTLPTTLGNIEVLINGRASPILSVSPTLITAINPWETVGSVVQIQVVSTAGVRSNAVTLFPSLTAPGVMTQAADGLSDAAAQHSSNFALITPGNPAQVGETIVLYAVGLGLVSPLLNDGQVAGSSPTSITEQPISVFIDGQAASIVGGPLLVPTLVNLYQMNVQVPSGVSSGEVFVDIAGPDSYTSESTIDIGSSGVAAAARAEKQLYHARPARGSGPRWLLVKSSSPVRVN